MATEKQHILVIRLGALGDLVFCFQAFYEIRRAHPDAEITLMTRANFAGFAGLLPWFDRVIVETHPQAWQVGAWIQLAREIKKLAPARIYDLQGKTRQTVLYMLLGGPFGPAWSGAAPLCKFPRVWPPKPDMHFTDFLAAQLRVANVPSAPKPDLSWLDAPTDRFSLPPRYAVLIPGCSPNAPYKRWPAQKFAEITHQLGRPCVVIGSSTDEDAVRSLQENAPAIINLCGKTNLPELAGILRRAAIVIGNDTGPTHMAAAVGAPVLALFSGRSNPVWSKPPGEKVAIARKNNLDDLTVDDVMRAAKALL